jgi:hypothetical protein
MRKLLGLRDHDHNLICKADRSGFSSDFVYCPSCAARMSWECLYGRHRNGIAQSEMESDGRRFRSTIFPNPQNSIDFLLYALI